MTIVLIAVGAAVGASLRYFVDRAIQSRHGSAFPWGTLIVNVVGSALFGAVVGAAATGDLSWLLAAGGVGFCGAFTTYSAFAYETARLVEDGSVWHGGLNVALSLAAGLAAAWLGLSVALAM